MKTKYLKESKIPMIEVENELGLKVVFSTIGASIYSISFNNELMTLTPKTFTDFVKSSIYYGKTIGGISNRVRNGLVKIDDKEYHLLLNEGENALHGGQFCLSNTVFTPKVTFGKNYFSILYSFKKKKMKDGLPGNITYYISYSLNDISSDLLIDFKAMSDDKTVVALTNHLYFCLGDENLDHLFLTIPADKYVEPNPIDLVPEVEKDIIPCLDFRKKKPIMKDINDSYLQNSKTLGYDHHFILNSKDKPIILENNRYKLEITSDFSGAQIYTDNYADNIEMKSTTYLNHRGVAIEPQDSPLERLPLEKNHLYHHQIVYSFSKK